MTEPRHLFVYGTLMPGATSALGREERERLQQATLTHEPAAVAGHLYDLGRYPGLVVAEPPLPLNLDCTVHGILLELGDPGAAFAWLDPYEGVTAEPDIGSEYVRAVMPVTRVRTPDRTVPAWLYLYRGSLRGARLIGSGRWG